MIPISNYSVYTWNTKHIYIETKEDNEEFMKYNRLDTVLKVSTYDQKTGKWSPLQLFYMHQKAKIKDLKEKILSYEMVAVENLILVKEESNGRKILKNDNQEVRDFWEGHKIYAEPNLEKTKEIDRVKNTTEIQFTNAPTKKNTNTKSPLTRG